MFSKILIANRGEIAVRIIRACRELGITVAAICSEADRRALHVRLADEAVAIRDSSAIGAYLSVDKILQAAKDTGAQAIHPGYGFLSENADFARAVQEAGLVFIGPPPETIQMMGSKAEARSRMQAAGVAVVPGYQGSDDDASLQERALEIGYPVLVKAAAGGGGKGMRVVQEASRLLEAATAARREARHAFGDSRLILERFIPNARHIEFQVLADGHGNTLHLFERDCSIQRRHQKIIEETPSLALNPVLRDEMGAAAVAAARAAGYQNAGTVEFILDPLHGAFYFLEMNTRIQVEHPITELVTGLDLVQWQIRIAAGERLPYQQEQIHLQGHAIECRLYAEDPAGGFLPAAGRLLYFSQPHGPGIRVDTGVASGDEVGLHYDPMLAKLSVLAEDRPAAIRRMLSALCDTVSLGLTTNSQFLQDVLRHPDFQAGQIHTTWVEDQFSGWQAPDCGLLPEVLAAAALSHLAAASTRQPSEASADPYSPWRTAPRARLGG